MKRRKCGLAKQQLLKQSRAWGLTNRRGSPLTSQAIGVMLRNQLYAGIVDVTEYAVRGKRGDFEPLVSEDLFFRVQAVMRLFKESVLQIWKARKAAVREELAAAERAAKTIQDKLDRLDEAFLFERSIEIETYDRHAEKLREELTLARIDRHSGQLDELDGRQLEPSRFTRRSAPGTR